MASTGSGVQTVQFTPDRVRQAPFICCPWPEIRGEDSKLTDHVHGGSGGLPTSIGSVFSPSVQARSWSSGDARGKGPSVSNWSLCPAVWWLFLLLSHFFNLITEPDVRPVGFKEVTGGLQNKSLVMLSQLLPQSEPTTLNYLHRLILGAKKFMFLLVGDTGSWTGRESGPVCRHPSCHQP